jgi:phospholipase/lecithinase/hemolysin
MTKQQLVRWLEDNHFQGTANVIEVDNFKRLNEIIEQKKRFGYAEEEDESKRICLNYLINYVRQQKLSQCCFND